MSGADGAAVGGVGLGVVLVVFDQTAAGMALMLLGVLGYIVISVGGDDRDRGQMLATPIWPVGIVIAAAVSLFIISDIMSHSAEEFRAAEENHVVCNGMFQCGPPGVEFLAVLGTVLPVAALLYLLRWKWPETVADQT